MRNKMFGWAVCAALAGMMLSTQAQASSFAVGDLGIGGAAALNDRGDVAGFGADGAPKMWLGADGTRTLNLPADQGGFWGLSGINDSRQAVITSWVPAPPDECEGCLYATTSYMWAQDGSLSKAPGHWTYLQGISNAGLVIGASDGVPLLWDTQTLEYSSPAAISTFRSISENGNTVGRYQPRPHSNSAPFFSSVDGGIREVTLTGSVHEFVAARDVNNRGVVVGIAYGDSTHSSLFTWKDGVSQVIKDLDSYGGNFAAHINDQGEVILIEFRTAEDGTESIDSLNP